MEETETCKACGACCKKHWLVKLNGKHEKEMLENHIVSGEYMFTDECPYFKNNKCTIQDDKPNKCKEYFCEGNPPKIK